MSELNELNESTEGSKGEHPKPSLFGMITNPKDQFERIKERPIIWGAMGILVILFIIGTWLISLGVDVSTELDGIEMDEDLEGFMRIFSVVGIIIGGIFIPLFSALLSSFIYWLVAKIAQSTVSFKQLFSMNTYILIITALGTILNGIIIALIGGSSASLPTSLGSIITSEGAIGGLFSSLEVFAIWTVILTAIGLNKVAGFSKGLAWTVAIIFFSLGVILAMVSAGFAGMAGV